MKTLTIQEEIKIIDSLLKCGKDLFIANGSSRAVFKHPTDPNKAIKIAGGYQGRAQNQNEVVLNGAYPELTNTIHERGFMVLVCDLIVKDARGRFDRVRWRKRDDLVVVENVEAMRFNLIENGKMTAEDYDQAKRIIDMLDTVNGSADGEQMGYTFDGRLVTYDYGYSRRVTFDDQVGNVYTMMAKKGHEGFLKSTRRKLKEQEKREKLSTLQKTVIEYNQAESQED